MLLRIFLYIYKGNYLQIFMVSCECLFVDTLHKFVIILSPMKLIKFILLLFFCLLSQIIYSQKHPIYEIENKLMLGDKNALLELSEYFDSNKNLIEYLGYHIIETTEKQVAKRIVLENCSFTETEFIIDEATSKEQFLNFLNQNLSKIQFSKIGNVFLITPLENRNVRIQFREIPDYKKIEIKSRSYKILSKDWAVQNQIYELIQEQNPKCLLIIASELYKIRYRFDIYHNNHSEFTELLFSLTDTEIGVENENKKITWHVDREFAPDASLNLLIYFAKYYIDFKWNPSTGCFQNKKNLTTPINKANELFFLMTNENDAVALGAFTELTNYDPEEINQLSDEYDKARIRTNYSLPTFPYRFLKQLSVLTDYCKRENIDYDGNEMVKKYIKRLSSRLSFIERRNLEDDLIKNLTLSNITTFEYLALINEKSWDLTYSAGRILDKFYSKNFVSILNDKKQLELYLKKSLLFNRLGIIGICNNYLTKFIDQQDFAVEKLNAIDIGDIDINEQKIKAKAICRINIKLPTDSLKVNESNRDFVLNNIKKEIRDINRMRNSEEKEDSLVSLLSKINYHQIKEALIEINNISFNQDNEWKMYSFLDRDFGFFLYDDFDDLATRNTFLKDYTKFNEYDFYKNMLNKSGVEYFDINGNLEYDKIFDALKYNVVVAFVGGGGGLQDNEVYSIIKLLELTHKTTLGYPKKLCNSNGMWACDSQDRANFWMQFLIENKLTKQQHNEPVSFHYK